MKAEKDWLEKMNENDFSSLTRRISTDLDKPALDIDMKIIEMIRGTRLVSDKSIRNKKLVTLAGYGAAAVAVITLTALFAIFAVKGNEPGIMPLVKSGLVTIAKEGKAIAWDMNRAHQYGESITTGVGSTYTMRAGISVIRLDPDTRITIEKVDSRDLVIYLEYGELLLRSGESTPVQIVSIRTPSAITGLARCMLVRYREGTSFVSLYRGKIEVSRNDTDAKAMKWILEEGESISVAATTASKQARLSEREKAELSAFAEMAIPPAAGKRTTLEISVRAKAIDLSMDGRPVQVFDENITLSLPEGKHEVVLAQSGYIRYKATVDLEANKPLALTPPLAGGSDLPKDPHRRQVEGSKEIYKYRNKDNPAENRILGFAGSGNRIIAVTRTSLICFDAAGNLSWERHYGEKMRILFDSLPLVHENTLYISSYYTLILLDIPTGIPTEVRAPGMISDGIAMTGWEKKLYIPYPDGIYMLSLGDASSTPEAFITFGSPVQPLVTERGIYLSSFLDKAIAMFSFNGTLKNRFAPSASSVCKPIRAGNTVIAADDDGHIYKFDADLNLLKTTAAGEGITRLVNDEADSFFAMTRMGNLVKIASSDLAITGKIKIDRAPDSGIYLYEYPVLVENDLLIGTEDGSVMVIDRDSFSVRDSRVIAHDGASCSLFYSGDALFMGTKAGSILRLEYKKE